MTTPQRRLRVLIADDHPDTCETLRMLIFLWGHDFKTAANGAAAIALAAAFVPDVLLLDLAMPRTDGYEVARRVRALPGMEGAYLVACTGFGDPEHVRRAKDAGFDLHLLKPVDPEVIRELLEHRAGAQCGLQ